MPGGVFDLAARHRVEGLIASALLNRDIPEDMRRTAQAFRSEAALAALRAVTETRRAAMALASAGIPAVLLKGVATALACYPDLGERNSRDIDLLVPDSEAEAAEAVLEGLGFAAVAYSDLEPPQRRVWRALSHEVEFTAPDGGLPIELHWRLAAPGGGLALRYEDLLPHTQILDLGGAQIRVLAPAMAALYAAHHGARHAWFRLKWLEDFRRIVERLTESEAEACRDLAGQYGVTPSLALGAHLLTRLYGADLPPAWSALPVEGGRVQALAAHCIAALSAPEEEGGTSLATLSTRLATWRYQRGLGHWGSLRRLVAGDPRDVALLRLGPRYLWLYRLAAPLLALVRLARNSLADLTRKR